MERVKEFFNLVSLKKYKIEIVREGFREILMAVIIAINYYILPVQQSNSRIDCVHKCILTSKTLLLNETFGLDWFYDEKCVREFKSSSDSFHGDPYGCKRFHHPSVMHECKSRHGLDDIYLRDKKSILANNVCKLEELERQTIYLGILFLVFFAWGLSQTSWVYLSQSGLQALVKIHNELNDVHGPGCLKKFFKNNRRPMCVCIPPQTGGPLVHLRDQRDSSLKIRHLYKTNCILNFVFCGFLVFCLFESFPDIPSEFDCGIPHSMSSSTHSFLRLDDMVCVNQDAKLQKFLVTFIRGLTIVLGVFFLACLVISKDILITLYNGIVA